MYDLYMKSKWFEYKEQAISLRKRGLSIRTVEQRLNIPRSTLSGWFKNIKLTQKQEIKLQKDWEEALIKARLAAVTWHNSQKKQRLEQAKLEALDVLQKIDINSQHTIELALAMLYLGEGSKSSRTGLGNSDPLILKFFLATLVKIFNVDSKKLRYDLHLRADQDPLLIKKYWANELKVPIERFTQVSIDKRTIGKPTYPNYKGVCVIDCGKVAIQRKLVYLSREFCKRIIDINMGG